MSDTATLAKIQEFRAKTDPSPWTHIPRAVFADSLTARVNDGDLIDTSNVNLCGPGAFFRNMAQDYPFLYAAIAVELYDKGHSSFFSFNIKGNDKLYRWKPSGKVDPVDWVVLATFRDNENTAWHFNSESDGFAGITMPHSLASWYKSIGYTSVDNSTNVWFTKGVDHLLKAGNYFNHGFRVNLFVNAQILYPNTVNSSSWFPDHWVVLDSPIDVVVRHTVKFLEFKVWCWGDVKRVPLNGTVAGINLTNNYYGYVVARP